MSVRCFVGVELPDSFAVPLRAASAAVRELDHSWVGEKWVAPENLHVTLAFIGSVPEDRLVALSESLRATIAGHQEFQISFKGLRAVPSMRRCRMLWADFNDPAGDCARLAAAIEESAVPYGAVPEERPFKAHVTLCRARHPKRIADVALEGARSAIGRVEHSMSVRQVTLFASRLTPRGPVYSMVDAWGLRGK